ncbi:aldo/keto reductase [Caldibacillus lycopersici]|uniref:Aldo/keto reductase n=1 Tax=Perspicuibacillus lycopersici TaxID=1325689 RepID=A0AAE3IUR8_9BACI|nr:aldo/keto reductase [Perspicuibacillus lycopersici]MCU9613774.1 aldo/keto reductase [Perspicuibacillus lycopersici]
METRKLGKSDLFVSKLGLGCMSLGTEERHATEIIHTALDAGINYFDTADLYDVGVNEQIVGKALKHVRDQVIIATKAGNRWKEDKSGWYWDASKAYIKEAVKQSLKRLGTEYIDLYQLHGGTMEDPIEETIAAFEELKAEGLIRYYGISSIRPTVIHEFVKHSNIDSVMMQYSILDRRPEEQAMPLLHDHGISVIARGPLARGLLSEAMLTKASEAIKKNGYLEYSYEELNDIIPKLKEKVANNRSLTSVSLQYVLNNPVVASAIAGASSVAQLKENIASSQASPLTTEEIQLVQKLTKTTGYREHRLG